MIIRNEQGILRISEDELGLLRDRVEEEVYTIVSDSMEECINKFKEFYLEYTSCTEQEIDRICTAKVREIMRELD